MYFDDLRARVRFEALKTPAASVDDVEEGWEQLWQQLVNEGVPDLPEFGETERMKLQMHYYLWCDSRVSERTFDREVAVAHTVVAYVELVKFRARVIREEVEKAKYHLRDEEDKEAFADMINETGSMLESLKMNMKRLMKED